MKHKHLTEKEILNYIKKKGKIPESENKIRECETCFYNFKRILYRQRFLKKQEEERKKRFFKIIYGKLQILGEEKKLATVHRMKGSDIIEREMPTDKGMIKIIMDISSIKFEFIPNNENDLFKIKITKDNELIAETSGGTLRLTTDAIQNSVVTFICDKTHYSILFRQDLGLKDNTLRN